MGGKPTGGIGFGSGIERLLLACDAEGVSNDSLLKRTVDLFVVDTTGEDVATKIVDDLRSAGFATERSFDGRSMKAQMKVADKSGARLALLIGPQEHAMGEVTIRDLRSDDFEHAQQRVAQQDVVNAIAQLLTK